MRTRLGRPLASWLVLLLLVAGCSSGGPGASPRPTPGPTLPVLGGASLPALSTPAPPREPRADGDRRFPRAGGIDGVDGAG